MYTLILYYYHTKFGPLSVNIASAVEHNHESCGVCAAAVRKGGKYNKKKQNAILDDVKTVVYFIIINIYIYIYYCCIITIIPCVVDCCRVLGIACTESKIIILFIRSRLLLQLLLLRLYGRYNIIIGRVS